MANSAKDLLNLSATSALQSRGRFLIFLMLYGDFRHKKSRVLNRAFKLYFKLYPHITQPLLQQLVFRCHTFLCRLCFGRSVFKQGYAGALGRCRALFLNRKENLQIAATMSLTYDNNYAKIQKERSRLRGAGSARSAFAAAVKNKTDRRM